MNVIEILVEDTAYADLEQKAEILMEEENVLYSSTENSDDDGKYCR